MKTFRLPLLANAVRPLLRTSRPPIYCSHSRTFIPLPFADTQPQSITASRTLPYPKSAIFDIISDVSQYSSFLPYCQQSVVTRWSNPDRDGKKWPEEATLVIGWGDIKESFQSRVHCVPNRFVEAVSGESATSVATGDVPNLLNHLVSRWTLNSASGPSLTTAADKTEVNLAIEFQFANPIYAALSAAVTPKMAEVMIRAFEDRVKKLLGKPTHH
jgi:coenzyme Q-binding protein COQ10